MSRDDAQPFVLLVEDEVLVRITLTKALESGVFSVMPVASAEEALEVLDAVPEVKAVVTDVNLSSSGINGFELARKIWSERRIGTVVVSGHVSPEHDEDLPPGAYFLGKPVHRGSLVQLVRSMVATAAEDVSKPGADWTLTPRQHEVLALVVQGKSNRDIAEVMGLSENTVKVHIAAIFRALGVSSRTEALLAGMKKQL
jgi:DNA-binding NarL/FixJ family response regulator